MKLHQKFFWLLLLLLPVQLGRHFWPDWSYVLGIKIDYLSPTLFLTDILVFLVLFFWFWEERKQFSIPKFILVFRKDWRLWAIGLFFSVNVFLAQNPAVAFLKFLKLLEMFFLSFFIARNRTTRIFLFWPLALAVIYSALIAVFQLFDQGSLNGLFWWLGERTFTMITPGIARTVVRGKLWLRPYATFPHPNVLAGFLLVALLLMSRSQKKEKEAKGIWLLALILGTAAIILSFSRTVWFLGILAGFGGAVKCYRPGKWGNEFRWLAVILGLVFLGGLSFVSPLTWQESLQQRMFLNQAAVEMIKTFPLAGVGLNNFVCQLPDYAAGVSEVRFLQPVHNLFLLTAAETGLVGLMIFLWFLLLTFKKLLAKKNIILLAGLGVILLTGMVDHYWLTLQQGQLLLALILGLSWQER